MSEDRKDFPLLHVYSQATARSPLKIAANTTGLRALIDTAMVALRTAEGIAAIVEQEAKTELFCNDAEAYEFTIGCDDSNHAWDSWQLPYPQEQSTQEPRVKVSPKILEKASRLFNASLTDIFNELLQNSRRSGASKVDIALVKSESETWIELADDGCGIFKDGVGVVLGESGWDETTRSSEDPAGMGIFSLAHRGATLESNGYRASLTEAQFCGREGYAVEECDRACGTKISFPLKPTEVERVEAAVKECSCYYPILVSFNGKEIDRREFLASAAYTQDWQGLKIGVTHPYKGNKINFYGLVIERGLPSVSEVGSCKSYEVRIEVVNAPDLKLVLPARKEVVQNKFFEELKLACCRVIYSYIATLESHTLSFEHWSRATNWGIVLPQAVRQLELYQPRRADGEREWWQNEPVISNDAIAVFVELDPPEAQVFWRAWEGASLPYTLYRAEPLFDGYEWYDALPRVSGVSLIAEVDGKRELVETAVESGAVGNAKRCDRVIAICTVVRPDGSQEQLELETDVAFWRDERWYNDDWEDVTVVLAKTSKIEPWELSNLLSAAYFNPSDDVEADSHYTQRENFQAEANQLACQLLCSKDEALIERLRCEVKRHLSWLLPNDRTVHISIDRSVNIHLGDVAENEITSERSLQA